MENNKDSGQYIWRTVQDDKVRGAHAAREGKTFSWTNPPNGGHPGEDYNCRCWAEAINAQATGLKQEIISSVNDGRKWGSLEFLKHFFFGGGNEVTLARAGYLRDIITKAEEIMYKNVENQVADKMRAIRNGVLIYRTENSYSRLGEVKWVFGGGTIQTITSGKVIQNGNTVSIDAEIQYAYYDEFTDIFDIRDLFMKPHLLSDLSPNWYTALGVTISEAAFGRMYLITGSWKTKLTGTVSLKE